jgi:cell wall-associated NlpC family hydrolase
MNTRSAICPLAVIPIRKEAAHRSEMVSQLLFGEYADIIEEEAQFFQVRCRFDGYEGWIQKNQLAEVEGIIETNAYIGSWSSSITIKGERIHVPFATPFFNEMIHFTPRKEAVSYSTKENIWDVADISKDARSLATAYKMFLGSPYLWGGKSVFGIDCSGFVQQVFKLCGITLLRDAYLQAEQGEAVQGFENAELGDLAFFHNEKGRITHVGLIIENNKIIHASGKVRIDTITQEGILNAETNSKTHELHSIRRFPGLLD